MVKDFTKEEVSNMLRDEISGLEDKKSKLQKKLEKELSNVEFIKTDRVISMMNEIDSIKYAINTLHTVIGKYL